MPPKEVDGMPPDKDLEAIQIVGGEDSIYGNPQKPKPKKTCCDKKGCNCWKNNTNYGRRNAQNR